MKKFITTYCMVLFAIFLVNCTTTEEGLDSANVIVVSTDKIEVSSKGGQSSITVDSYCPWQITSSEDWSWIKTTASSGHRGKLNFKLILSENTSVEDRTATVTIFNDIYGVSQDISVLQEAGAPYINLSKSEISSPATGSTVDVSIDSNVDYTISSSESWCKVNANRGDIGKTTLRVTIQSSPSTSKRTATIKITNTKRKVTKEITVSQVALKPSLEVSGNTISATNEGITKSLTVTSNIAWSATCAANWVTLTPVNGTSGTTTLKATIAANPTTVSRTATIKVANQEYNITKEISVTQSALIPSLEVSDNAITANSTERTKSITITSSIAWTATCEANWVTLTPVNGKSGTTTLNATIAANPTTSSRTATIKVQNNEYGITKNITVSQEALNPSLEVSVNTISATVQGLTKQLTVTSTIPWVATCEEDWVTLSPVNGTSGTTTLKATIAANPTTASRTATIKVQNSEFGITKTIAISQKPLIPSLEVSDNTISEISAPASGLTEQLTITSSIDWTATCAANWVTLTPANGTSGTTTLKVTIAANTLTSTRTTTIKVTNAEHNIVKNIVVNQEAITKSYTVNLNSQWRLSSSVSNPSSSTYDGVYESNSNYNISSGTATMYIDIEGYDTFTIYVRSNAESTYDYVMVSQLDKNITGSTSYSDTSLVKAHTRGNQQSSSSISYYTKVTYSNISSGKHRITIVYRKDGSDNYGTDRGYVLIPKNQ